MKRIYILLTIAIPVFFFSCKGPSIERANEFYKLHQFAEAADMYESLIKKQKTSEEKAVLAYKAGECYRRMNNYRKAELLYSRAIRYGYPDPIIHHNYAQVLLAQAEDSDDTEYQEAQEQLNLFKEKSPGNPQAKATIKAVNLYDSLRYSKSRYVAEEAREFNTRDNDFAPAYYKEDEAIVFTSDREGSTGKKEYGWTGKLYTDLWVSEKERRGDKFEKPVLVEGSINTKFNEGVATFNDRGSIIYYTQCNGNEGKSYNCKILEAKRKGREWSDPTVIAFIEEKDSFVKYGHPSLSKDEKKMFFSANIDDSSNLDIYVSHYVSRSRTWGDPVNLGPVINSPGKEMYPFIANDTTLYFASDGHPGLGGLDIFVSYWNGENWTEPKNLRYPINSSGDDFGITFHKKGEKGYFSTNREGDDDIWSFYMVPKVCVLQGTVYNIKTKKPEPSASVTLYSRREGFEPVTITANDSGFYKFESQFDCDFVYFVQAEKEKFFNSQREKVDARNVEVSRTFIQDLWIDPIPPTEIQLEGIYYGLDSFNLRKASMKILDSLVGILKDNPSLVIELASHTDCRSTMKYNDTLSQKRAKSVVDYLIQNGIERERLVPKGYGERQLVNDCACEGGAGKGRNCTEEEHQANRRTTFRVLRTDYKPKPEIKKEQPDTITKESVPVIEGEDVDSLGQDSLYIPDYAKPKDSVENVAPENQMNINSPNNNSEIENNNSTTPQGAGTGTGTAVKPQSVKVQVISDEKPELLDKTKSE